MLNSPAIIVLMSLFLLCCLGLFNMLSSFSSKEQASFNFMAAVTIRSDFGAQENKICHCYDFQIVTELIFKEKYTPVHL